MLGAHRPSPLPPPAPPHVGREDEGEHGDLDLRSTSAPDGGIGRLALAILAALLLFTYVPPLRCAVVGALASAGAPPLLPGVALACALGALNAVIMGPTPLLLLCIVAFARGSADESYLTSAARATITGVIAVHGVGARRRAQRAPLHGAAAARG